VDLELAYIVGDTGGTKEQVLEVRRQETARVVRDFGVSEDDGGVEIAFGESGEDRVCAGTA
jgi:hypothetical protein